MKEIIKTTILIKHNKVYTMLSSKSKFFLDMQVDVQNTTVLSADGSSIKLGEFRGSDFSC